MQIFGIQEHKDENLDMYVIGLLNESLNREYHFDHRTLERIHRLGLYRTGKTRPVIARFAKFKDDSYASQESAEREIWN